MPEEKAKIMIKRFFSLPLIMAVTILPFLIFNAGCNIIAGGAAALSTPTSSEMKVPAEYDLASQKAKKIAILVDQSPSLNNQVNVRAVMTNALNALLHEQMDIPVKYLISYDTVAELRSNTPEYSTLTPDRIGSALGADFVLHVEIVYCRIIPVSQWEFLNGDMTVHAELFNVETGRKLWPDDGPAKVIQVGFESKHLTKDAAVSRLVYAAARCITRDLYNGPKNQFKVTDEKSDVGWGQ
jgi:hypothetical protein